VIPRFVAQALAGKPITVYGTGEQTRCFCDVRDVVWALTELVRHDGAFGEVFNIGSTDEISIGALARMVQSRVGSPSEIVCIPYEEAYAEGFEDMLHRVPDTSKIRSITGFEPRVDLPTILDRIIAFHRESLDAEKNHSSRFEPGYERRYGHDSASRHGV
jgi:UDP-glucose 4-epimerase